MRLMLAVGFAQAFCSASPAQDEHPPSCLTVRKLFELTPKSTDGIPALWVACNKDSSYYHSDTLELYNNFTWCMTTDCCQFIRWMPDGNQKLDLTGLELCVEPPLSNIAFQDQDLGLSIRSAGSKTILALQRQKNVVDEFEVIDLRTIVVNDFEESQQLLLRRIRN